MQSAHDDDASAQAIVTFLQTFVPEMDRHAQLIKANAHRRVYRVHQSGQTLFVKQHVSRGLIAMVKHAFMGSPAAVELRASRYAQTQGVPAVRMLGKFERRDGWTGLLSSSVSLGIDNAIPLTEKYSELAAIERDVALHGAPATLAQAVTRLLAIAHDRAFLQRDLHPANVLIQPIGPAGCAAVFVDLAAVRCGAEVTEADAARNLAALDQWFRSRSRRSERFRFLTDYANLRRKWPSRTARKRFAQRVESAAQRHARKLFAQRDCRIGRQNAFFDRQRSADGSMVVSTIRFRRAPELLGVQPPDGARAAPDHATSPPPSESFFAPDRATGLSWRLFGCPAWRKYRSACLLMNRDLPTVVPLACRWSRRGLSVNECGWRMLRPADGTTLVEWLDIAERGERRSLLESVGRLLADTLARGAVIHDPAPVRIEVAGMLEERPRIYWAGVTATATSVPAPRHACLWMLAQLAAACDPSLSLTRAERARALRACCRRLGRGVLPGGWRAAWRTIASMIPPPVANPPAPLEKTP